MKGARSVIRQWFATPEMYPAWLDASDGLLMITLLAIPDTVLIDRKVELTGTAHIIYSPSYYGPILWERIVDRTPWTRIGLEAPRVFNSPSGDPQLDGEFSRILEPGQVYQVVMYSVDDIDPNSADPNGPSRGRAEALVTVVALLKDPENENLITDQAQNAGGTWFAKVVQTAEPATFMLQVSDSPSFVDTEGVERFLVPLGTAFGLDLATFHNRLIDQLLPGNDYFYLARVVDSIGNWQVVRGQFRTKQRKVTIHFDKLHVINDGAVGDTSAEFRIWVMEGKASIKQFFFGDVDNFPITDSPSPGKEDRELIPIDGFCPPFVIGPKDVTAATHRIGILTRGLCKRTLGANDPSSNFGLADAFPNPVAFVPLDASFPFRTGSGEQMVDFPFSVRTHPQEADVEFEYSLFMRFTVDYF